jgi:hypothetical protein
VYAQAADGIRDLDLLVEDSVGIVVGEDASENASGGARAIVLPDGAVCFRADDKARVVVSVGMGAGSYAIQIWAD